MSTTGPRSQERPAAHSARGVSREELDNLRDELRDTLAEQKQLRKEYQEFKEAVEEREKYKDRLWKERIAFISIIVALIIGLVSLIATMVV